MSSSSYTSARHGSHSSSDSSSSQLSTSPAQLDARTHKHYHSHTHVETPFPVVEHAATWSTGSGTSSSGSFFEVRKHNHHGFVPKHLPSLPNPVHAVEDHIAEFRFGHAARSAKRDAKRLAEYQAQKSAGSSGRSVQHHSPVDTIQESEETTIDWREHDERAWADELKKREAARRMSCDTCGGWSGGWTMDQAGHKGSSS